MPMTPKESDRVADAVEDVAKLAAQIVRLPPGHRNRPQMDELLRQAKAELSEALRTS